MDVDGWITIGTKLDNSQLQAEHKKLISELKNKEKDLEKLLKIKAKIEFDLQAYEEEKKMIEDFTNERLQFAQTENEVNETLEIEKLQLEELDEKYSTQFEKLNEINQKIDDNVASQSALKEETERVNAEMEKFKLLSSIKGSIDDVGKSIQNVTKKVIRWGLAIFGVRSAYMFVRQAMSTLAQYNEQIAVDIQYIRYALAATLQPVIEKIIKTVYTLLQYLGMIVKQIFGINIFKNSGIDKFQEGMKSSAKSAKEIKNQLTGFDEMNVLQDTSSSSGDTGTSGATPSLDLSKIGNQKVPTWMEWIFKNGELVAKIIGVIGVAIAGLKIGTFLQKLGLFANIPLIQLASGIALILGGIIILVKGIIDFINDPSWQNFLTILEGIALIVAGIAVIMGAWVVALVALGVAIVSYVIKNWDKVKEILGKVGQWIYDNIIKPILDFFKGLWEGIQETFSPAIEFFSNLFGTIFENIKIVIENLKIIFSFLWNKIKEIFSPVANFFKDKFTDAFNKIKKIFEPLANFFGDLWNKIKQKLKDFGAKVGEVIGGAFKKVINAVIKAIESFLNKPIKAINNLIDILQDIPGLWGLTKLRTFSFPRLAKGGIINYPNRGVPIGNAIGGESGKEGVIPLTDSQQMALLGEAIGKYITINADIPIIMNGRMLSREMRKVDNKTNFATNGRW